jgi:hypothetical protein
MAIRYFVHKWNVGGENSWADRARIETVPPVNSRQTIKPRIRRCQRLIR